MINEIHNEDCLITMAKMPDNFVDITMTSPPYNFDNGSGLGCKYSYAFKSKGYKDNLTADKYFEWQKSCISEMIRVSGLVFYNIQMIAGNKDALFQLMGYFYKQLKEIIIWDKLTAEPAISENVLNSQFEFILVFCDNNKRKFETAYFNRGELSNVFYIKKNHNWRNKLFKENTATFPIKLPIRVIENFTKSGGLVYDPFMGMGTTAVACMELGRKYIGSEISEEYCSTARERIRKYSPQLIQETMEFV